MAYNDHENVILNFGNSLQDAFICDRRISGTITFLNEKGYTTSECCAGHSDKISLNPNTDFWQNDYNVFQRDNSINLYEQIDQIKKKAEKPEFGIKIEVSSVDENEIRVVPVFERTKVYIFFPIPYNFPPLDGFDIINNEKFSCVQKMIKFRKENGYLKSHDEIEKELEEANLKLLEWAECLSYSNQKTDEEGNIKQKE